MSHSVQGLGRRANPDIGHGQVGVNRAVVLSPQVDGASSIRPTAAPLNRRHRNGPPESFSCCGCMLAVFRVLFRCLFGWMCPRNDNLQNRVNPRSPVEDHEPAQTEPVIGVNIPTLQFLPVEDLNKEQARAFLATFPDTREHDGEAFYKAFETLPLAVQEEVQSFITRIDPKSINDNLQNRVNPRSPVEDHEPAQSNPVIGVNIPPQQPLPAEDSNKQQARAFLAMFPDDEECDPETFCEAFKRLPPTVQKEARRFIISSYPEFIKDIKEGNARGIKILNQNRERGESVKRHIEMTDDEAAVESIKRMSNGPLAVKTYLKQMLGIEEADDE